MQIEDYFDFIADTAIRIRGTRVGIETVIDAYRAGAAPEEILIRYPALSLQQIYVTIAYYLMNQERLDTYVRRVRADQEAGWQEQQRTATPFIRELRERLGERRKRLQDEAQRPQLESTL